VAPPPSDDIVERAVVSGSRSAAQLTDLRLSVPEPGYGIRVRAPRWSTWRFAVPIALAILGSGLGRADIFDEARKNAPNAERESRALVRRAWEQLPEEIRKRLSFRETLIMAAGGTGVPSTAWMAKRPCASADCTATADRAATDFLARDAGRLETALAQAKSQLERAISGLCRLVRTLVLYDRLCRAGRGADRLSALDSALDAARGAGARAPAFSAEGSAL
jgi:hypothetical protein